jgi:hypothetical protein
VGSARRSPPRRVFAKQNVVQSATTYLDTLFLQLYIDAIKGVMAMAGSTANPNLVAAAPAMLAVLEEIAVMVDGSGACILPGSPIMKRVKEALAGAKGSQLGPNSQRR